MAGSIIYSFPVFRAIEKGYVKRLKAVVLNPATLRYVRDQDGEEITVSLSEVVRLGESDADFRRSIVSSRETLSTIVDCSIHQLNKLRAQTQERRHTIIASAPNYAHCIQITEAYRSRGLRAAYIHSKEESVTNARTLTKLEHHQLDAIVQVRKLGEGFDHPWLSIAVVCSLFANLSPFVQFVGRVTRAVVPGEPCSPLNQGIVVYHAGSNIAQRWTDFKDFSQADQEFFDQLLPIEDVNFHDAREIEIEPTLPKNTPPPSIEGRAQEGIELYEDPLVELDDDLADALDRLLTTLTPDQIKRYAELRKIRPRKQQERRAGRLALDDTVRNEAGRLLSEKGINKHGKELDRARRNRTNFAVLKSAIDKEIAAFLGRGTRQRDDYTRDEIARVRDALPSILARATNNVFDNE